MLYEIRDHSLLSAEALAMASNDEALEGHALVAEILLGLDRVNLYEGDEAEIVTIAVVRQVNLQVVTEPDASIAASWSSGERSVNYRDSITEVDPIAEMLLASLPSLDGRSESDRWPTVRTIRPTGKYEMWDGPLYR